MTTTPPSSVQHAGSEQSGEQNEVTALLKYAFNMLMDNLQAVRAEMVFKDRQLDSNAQEPLTSFINKQKARLARLPSSSATGPGPGINPEAAGDEEFLSSVQELLTGVKDLAITVAPAYRRKGAVCTYDDICRDYKGSPDGTICGVVCFTANWRSPDHWLTVLVTEHSYVHVGVVVYNTGEAEEPRLDFLETTWTGTDDDGKRRHPLKERLNEDYVKGCTVHYRPLNYIGQDGKRGRPEHSKLIESVVQEMDGQIYNLDHVDLFCGFAGRAKLKAHRDRMWCSEFVAMFLQRAKVLKQDWLPHSWAPCHFDQPLNSQCTEGWKFGSPIEFTVK